MSNVSLTREQRGQLNCFRDAHFHVLSAPPTILGTGLTWRGMGIMGVTRENATEITIKTGIMYTASDSAPYNSSMPCVRTNFERSVTSYPSIVHRCYAWVKLVSVSLSCGANPFPFVPINLKASRISPLSVDVVELPNYGITGIRLLSDIISIDCVIVTSRELSVLDELLHSPGSPASNTVERPRTLRVAETTSIQTNAGVTRTSRGQHRKRVPGITNSFSGRGVQAFRAHDTALWIYNQHLKTYINLRMTSAFTHFHTTLLISCAQLEYYSASPIYCRVSRRSSITDAGLTTETAVLFLVSQKHRHLSSHIPCWVRSKKMLVFLVIVFLAVTIACGVASMIESSNVSPKELVLSGTYQCIDEGSNRFLMAGPWVFHTVWEVLALSLASWIAFKHFREMKQWTIEERLITTLIQTHVYCWCLLVPRTSLSKYICTPTSISAGADIYVRATEIDLLMQLFVLGLRLALSVREYNAKLPVNSDAGTGLELLPGHVYAPCQLARVRNTCASVPPNSGTPRLSDIHEEGCRGQLGGGNQAL
ncbi:hypothetical protein EDB19DRAFT_1832709 [Suillus lakei]|nr:hypothetical protein EDB19DRAFT_1832709 [Suillus lakei]